MSNDDDCDDFDDADGAGAARPQARRSRNPFVDAAIVGALNEFAKPTFSRRSR